MTAGTASTAGTPPAVLTCPKCHGKMRSYERSGIVLEQCEDCRGIYLDHGELERFVEAEGGGWSGRIGPPRPEWTPDAEPKAGTRRGRTARLPRIDGGAPGDAERRRREELLAAMRELFGEGE